MFKLQAERKLLMSDEDKTQNFIKWHTFGTPEIKPDEKREFLGNFRERVALALTIKQLNLTKTAQIVKKVLQDNPDLRLYINGKMAQSLIDQYMKMAIELDYDFTILVQNGKRIVQRVTMNDFGIVIASPNEKLAKRIIL